MNIISIEAEPPPPPWRFGDAFRLLETQRLLLNIENDRKAYDADEINYYPKGLGDLDRVWDFLGVPRGRSGASDSTNSPCSSTAPSSVSDAPHYELESTTGKGKEVRWEDQVGRDEFTHSVQKHLADGFSSPTRSVRRKLEVRNTADFESEPEESLPRTKPNSSPWVAPPSITRFAPSAFLESADIKPLVSLTFEEKRRKLVSKLKSRYICGPHLLSYPEHLTTVRACPSPVDVDGIHIFVDCSNIIIGWMDHLRSHRGYPKSRYMNQAPVSWSFLAMVLERGRAVARRVLAGSHGSPKQSSNRHLPTYLVDAEFCGYELNILERVLKHKVPTPKKKRGTGSGYATNSGYSSSDGMTMVPKAVAEQGVDEILQMKILESIVDTQKPSTIVLASGDAAEAEYSGGFLKNVERALAKGWKVELVAWSSGLGGEYRAKGFLKKWKEQFTIIELDDFSEDLLAHFAARFTPDTTKISPAVLSLNDILLPI